MNRSGFFETAVGVIVIAVAAAFMIYAYGASGKSVGRDQYRLEAMFGRVDGVAVGSEVRIAGVKVGSVVANDLNFQTYEAKLQLAINANIPIPEDSIAKIVSDGLLGGAHVSIEPGASEDMLQEGDVITITQGSVDLLGLAVQAFTNPPAAGGGQSGGDDSQTERDSLGDL